MPKQRKLGTTVAVVTPRVTRVTPEGRLLYDPFTVVNSEPAKKHFQELAENNPSRHLQEIVSTVLPEVVVGRVYEGRVRAIVSFGAFVEILPGVDGLLHISELEHHRVDRVEDVLHRGDLVKVKVVDLKEREDKSFEIRLSRKVLLPEPQGGVAAGEKR